MARSVSEASVAEEQSEQIRSYWQRAVAAREFDRRDQRNLVVERALLSSRRAQRGADVRERFHRTGAARLCALGPRGREPEMIVAAFDGGAIAQTHPEDGLLPLGEDGDHPMGAAAFADDGRSGADFTHRDVAARREHGRIERLRLSHARPRREDDEVAGLEPTREPIEI